MKLRSMEEKISYRLFLMGFLGLIFTAVLCIFVFHKAFTAQAWSALERETDLVRAGYEQTGDPTQLSAFVTDDLRVTLISQDGSVLFESATDQPMENHLTRPEIRDAIANGEGRDIRDSQTMGYETYYYALRLSGGDVLRVAQDAETVWSIYDATIPAIVLSCVALMLAAAVLAALLTKALVQPVLNMTEDLDHIQENVPYRELIPFAESIHSDRILRENNEKMRQEFTANVSHELKTPLTSISGYAELIETGIAKPEDVPDFGQDPHTSQSSWPRKLIRNGGHRTETADLEVTRVSARTGNATRLYSRLARNLRLQRRRFNRRTRASVRQSARAEPSSPAPGRAFDRTDNGQPAESTGQLPS